MIYMRAIFVIAALLVTPASALDTNAVVGWADQNCATGTSECSEFASDALKAGGEDYCWNKWAPTLVNCLLYGKNPPHYYKTSFPGPRGSVVVYYDSKGPYHVAISKGDGTTDQHNHNACGENGNWATNYVIAPYGASELAWLASGNSTGNESLHVPK